MMYVLNILRIKKLNQRNSGACLHDICINTKQSRGTEHEILKLYITTNVLGHCGSLHMRICMIFTAIMSTGLRNFLYMCVFTKIKVFRNVKGKNNFKMYEMSGHNETIAELYMYYPLSYCA